MKHLVFIFVSLLLFARICEATVSVFFPAPQDDPTVKLALWTNSATTNLIVEDRKASYKLEDQLMSLSESKLKALFGDPQDVIPDGYILYVDHPTSVYFTGYGYNGNHKSFFLTIGNVGGLLVFPRGRDDMVSTVVIYLKTDSNFTPLRSSSDYAARRNWELKHTKLVEEQIRKALSK